MAETTLNIIGGQTALDLLEKATDYYNIGLIKYSHIKDDSSIEVILRHPETEYGFSLPKKQKYEVEEIIKTIEKFHYKETLREIDHSNPNKKDAFLSAYADYIANHDTDIIVSQELEKEIIKAGKKANEGYNPYESYLALKEVAEEKGLSIFLKDEHSFHSPKMNEEIDANIYVEYYRENEKLPLFSAIMLGDGKVKTFREERDMDNQIFRYLSNDFFTSTIEELKQNLSFAIARVNNQERVLREYAEKSLTNSHFLFTVNRDTRERIINYAENHSDLKPKPLNSADFLAIADVWARELSKPTELSKGMTASKIDETHADYIHKHHFALQKEQSHKNDIELHKNDWIIIQENGEFLKFQNGQIIIYNNREEAIEDLSDGEQVINVLELSEKHQNILIENIKEFNTMNEPNKILEKTNEKGQAEAILKVWENGKAEKTDYTYSENGTLQETKEYFGEIKGGAKTATSDSLTFENANESFVFDYQINTKYSEEGTVIYEKRLDFIEKSSVENTFHEKGNLKERKIEDPDGVVVEHFDIDGKLIENKTQIQDIFNEIKETFNPKEKAYFQRELANTDPIGVKEFIEFIKYSGISDQERKKVHTFFAEKNFNEKEKWELFKKTEMDDDFRSEVNPIFLDVSTNDNEAKKEYKAESITDFYKNYVIDPNKALSHNDIYAFINQSGAKHLKEILAEQFPNITFPKLNKSAILENIVNPIRNLSEEEIKNFKQQLETLATHSVKETQVKESTPAQENKDWTQYYADIRKNIDANKPVSHTDIYALINAKHIPAEKKVEIVKQFVPNLTHDLSKPLDKSKLLHDIVYPLRENNQSEAFKTALKELYTNTPEQEIKPSNEQKKEQTPTPNKQNISEFYTDYLLNYNPNQSITHIPIYAYVNLPISDTEKMETLNNLAKDLGRETEFVLIPDELQKLSKNKVLKELVYPLRENSQSLEEEFKHQLLTSFIQSREKSQNYDVLLDNLDIDFDKTERINIDIVNKALQTQNISISELADNLNISLKSNSDTDLKIEFLREINQQPDLVENMLNNLENKNIQSLTKN